MFADLLKRLSGEPVKQSLTPEDERLALCALMVKLARADNFYEASEVDMITSLMIGRFDLSLQDAVALREEAEQLEEEASDMVRFTRAIKEAVPFDRRRDVVTDLWKVALADKTRDDEENSMLRLVVSLLGVNDRDSALARQKAEIELGLS